MVVAAMGLAVFGFVLISRYYSSGKESSATKFQGDAITHVRKAGMLFEPELDPVYATWLLRPGEHLSVLDNASDMVECISRTGANATTLGVIVQLESDASPEAFSPERLSLDMSDLEMGEAFSQQLPQMNAFATVYLGEHNNPYFMQYPAEFQKHHRGSYMQDLSGDLIVVAVTANPISHVESAVPAVDDPVLTGLASELIEQSVSRLGASPFITSWVIGAEEAYPDYFGLPMGDFRPAFILHFQRYLKRMEWDVSEDLELVFKNDDTPTRAAWFRFREQAMADRVATYMSRFLSADKTRPVFYPTHGHPFSGTTRLGLGLSPTLLAGACDGLEMGHITINDDSEDLNLLYLTTFTAMGKPVMVPRLGNKTLAFSAQGGGRSFTPRMLRRLVYECLGMGVWHIGPIHWRSELGDGEWFIKDTPAEAECKKVFAEIRRAWPLLDGMSRLQPKVALYVADDTWMRGWNPRWTGFFQDAVANHWQITVVGDGQLSPDLAGRIPALISIDNEYVSLDAQRRLAAYTEAGGRCFVYGEFASGDELGRQQATPFSASAAHPENFISLPGGKFNLPRLLVNSFQTGFGAYPVPHVYIPVDFAVAKKTILAHLPGSACQPFEVQANDPGQEIRILPLTDGVSLMCVLINMSDDAATVRIKPAAGILRGKQQWGFLDVNQGARLTPSEDETVELAIGASGSAMVWMYPLADETAVQQVVREAEAALRRWKELGANVAPVEQLVRKALEYQAQEQLAPKAYCLGQRVLHSVCLKTEAQSRPDGRYYLQTSVYDAAGTPAGGMTAALKITPGDATRYTLSETTVGTYSVTVSVADLPSFYDLELEEYVTVSGFVRLVVSARGDGVAGGDMVVMEL